MGDLLRRYWLPFRRSQDLSESDGAPLRIRLLGEDLVAFRQTNGAVALLQRHCPHRWADLFFGRNEEDGIRCTYHGWKFDLSGRCVDMPTESSECSFMDKVRVTAYPVVERGGILWAYMGPSTFAAQIPDFEFLHVPDDHRYVSWNLQRTNFAQGFEGVIDSSHSNYLHSTLDAYHTTDAWREAAQESGSLRDQYHARDRHPKFFARDTDYGVIIGARRNTGEGVHYWRNNLYLLPFYGMPPGPKGQFFFQAFVPIDDFNTMRWTFVWNPDGALPSALIERWRNGFGLHTALIPGNEHVPFRNRENDYLINRHHQQNLTFTGIVGTGEQDYSVQEGMGRITPRHKEHLGTTDIGIIRARRRLLREATALQDGVEPASALNGEMYHLRSVDALLPLDADWVNNDQVQQRMTATW